MEDGLTETAVAFAMLIRAARILWPILFLVAGNAAAQTAETDATKTQACSLSAWSTDKDPAGLDVRAGPGTDYPVVGRLPPPEQIGGDEYAAEVDIVDSKDGWFRIKRATTNNYGDGDLKVVFEGDGWISGRFLGRSVEGPRLTGSPSSDAPVVVDLLDRPGDKKGPDYFFLERLLACKGHWIEIEGTYFGKRLRGWTDDTCGNQVTTCP